MKKKTLTLFHRIYERVLFFFFFFGGIKTSYNPKICTAQQRNTPRNELILNLRTEKLHDFLVGRGEGECGFSQKALYAEVDFHVIVEIQIVRRSSDRRKYQMADGKGCSSRRDFSHKVFYESKRFYSDTAVWRLKKKKQKN